jgi:Spy/CpxP family protein refolding chaperone
MKKTVLGALVALMFGTSVPALAQEPQGGFGGNDQQDMSEMIEKRATRLAKDMKLDDATKTKFVDLYKQYSNDLMGAMTQGNKKSGDQAQQGDNDKKDSELTDAEATQKIQESFDRSQQQIDRQVKQLQVKKAYYEKFKAFLTPQQLMKVMIDQRGMRNRTGNNSNGMGNRMGGMGGPGGGFGGGMGGPGGGF